MPKLNVLLHTTSFRGDHSADVAIALDVEPTATILELLKMCEGKLVDAEWHNGDYIAIRVAHRPEP